MKKIFFVFSVVALLGCATAKNIQLHNGEPGYLIDCSGKLSVFMDCVEKAKDVCSSGYAVTHIFNNGSDEDDREMLIKCTKGVL